MHGNANESLINRKNLTRNKITNKNRENKMNNELWQLHFTLINPYKFQHASHIGGKALKDWIFYFYRHRHIGVMSIISFSLVFISIESSFFLSPRILYVYSLVRIHKYNNNHSVLMRLIKKKTQEKAIKNTNFNVRMFLWISVIENLLKSIWIEN